MANGDENTKLISRKHSGFPEWLDFEKLRREGIGHIGELAGKIWTDHNAHDPGITTLEALCYALMDLGYRTNLPAADIFARNPDEKGPDTNFFTPAEILTVNPLTITDFRKLLIDIPGIRNAWLEVATDITVKSVCPEKQKGGRVLLRRKEDCCIDYLNGLYHVYLDTEKDLESAFDSAEARTSYVRCLIEQVKNKLMTHRNLCEDFVDVKILCKWNIGVCAEIELEDNADPEKVYLDMVEQLRQFFTPAPKFYTLSQMLDKGVPMDEIFGGRPMDLSVSHGFLDTQELEQLRLKKSIHVSDVYGILFDVPGVRKVRRLRLINCSGNKSVHPEWTVPVPEHHVPEFDINCSGFSFMRRGVNVSFDFRKYDALLQLHFQHNGKVPYTVPSLKLDREIPKGNFHKDLGTYDSIQNEFPRVYGIAEGGLPDSAPTRRKAQALQFKGFLLFFDQLLANYLAQLQHLRSLFPVRTPRDVPASNATYFTAVPEKVPDFQQLVRYRTDESGTVPAGETGFLAFPVSRAHIEDIIAAGKADCIRIEDLTPYVFPTETEKGIALGQMQEDLLSDSIQVLFLTRKDECVLYYIVTSSPDFVLVSRKYYSSEQSAMIAAASVKYAGTIATNYRTSILASGYSFSVELNITGYAEFLQTLTAEDPVVYQRKQAFLDHLLARFAERFSDFALLSYGFLEEEALQERDIAAKKQFLANYPLLGSTRGKGFDYTADQWVSDNNSGFEKRFRAFLGHDQLRRRSLCNFEVYDFAERYIFRLALSKDFVISTDEPFRTKEDAAAAARDLVFALGSAASYSNAPIPYSGEYGIYVDYGHRKEAALSLRCPTREEADLAIGYLSRLVATPPANGSVFVSGYRYQAQLRDAESNLVRIFSETTSDREAVTATALKALRKINQAELWGEGPGAIGKLLAYPGQIQERLFIDESHFKTDINNTIIGKPDKYNYEFLDRENHFMFRSMGEFDDEKQAAKDCTETLSLLADPGNLSVATDINGDWRVFVMRNGEPVAACSRDAATADDAAAIRDEIRAVIRPFIYQLTTEAIPDTWQYSYDLGYAPGQTARMISNDLYRSQPEAEAGLLDFSNRMDNATVDQKGDEWQLIHPKRGKTAATVAGTLNISEKSLAQVAAEWVGVQKEMMKLKELILRGESLDAYVQLHEDSKCRHVYQLVDKDGIYAIHNSRSENREAAKKLRMDIFAKDPASYGWLDLLLRGNIHERKDPRGFTWYHYRIQTVEPVASPVGNTPRQLVLFESVTGYLSEEEAAKAFAATYMEILTLALNPDNYGEAKPISEKVLVQHEKDGCPISDSIVFILPETLDFLGTYPQQAIGELIRMVKSYPIRSIRRNADKAEFHKRFESCTRPGCNDKTPQEPCTTEKEQPVYYFVLYDRQTDQEAWQSVSWYESPAAAMEAFRFFYLLLSYEGNFTIQCDCHGKFRIHVREVLLASVNRYSEAQWAWGTQGVEQLVRVAQQDYSFHAYLDEACCYRFFVACRNTRVYHPCTYDSPEKRDRVMRQLQQLLPGILSWKLDFCCGDWDSVVFDFEGNPVARIIVEKGTLEPSNRLDAYIDLFTLIGNHVLSLRPDGTAVRLDNCNGLVIDFYPVSGKHVNGPDSLKELLQWMACYFPFVRNTGKDLRPSYCIEIRLPGFNICSHCDDSEDEPCAVAWMSACCADNCKELMLVYQRIISWLQQSRLYRAVFECPCGPYGIELYDYNASCVGTDRPAQVDVLSAIIARSPQCYPSAEMVCEAIKRAKRLINSEGLHLIEHILLRPHCEDECDCIVEPCTFQQEGTFDQCEFPDWDERDEEDPCDERKPVCFQPGHDPYSFIATVALPAWPERFNSAENRLLLETLLHREAPAHVALRVLWLTPHDMCCFEAKYRNWLSWIAYHESCGSKHPTCDLVNYLFHRGFACWDNIDPCDDCGPQEEEPVSCIDKIKRLEVAFDDHGNCAKETWSEQVDELFCWKGVNCDDRWYVDCDKAVVSRPDVPLPDRPGYIAVAYHTTASQRTPQFINSRIRTRKDMVTGLEEDPDISVLAVKTKRYLEASTPQPARLGKLIEELTRFSADASGKGQPNARLLITLLVHAYADNIAFGNGKSEPAKSRAVFAHLRESGIDLEQMYEQWQPGLVGAHVQEERLEQIRKLFHQ